MTLGWYCGAYPFGPWDPFYRDLTRCFQSLIILLPPSLFLLLAFAYRMSRIRHIPASSLLLDPLPRFPQIISASLCLLSLIYLGYFLLSMGGVLAPFMVLWPALSFFAWIASLLLLRFEHSRHVPSSPPINRVFYFLSFVSAAKLGESSVMNCLYSPQLTAYDVLVFLNLFLSCFMLRYALTGVVARGGRLTLWDDLEDGLGTSIQQDQQGEDAPGPAATPTRRDKGMWKRFLAFSANGHSDAGGDGYGDDVGSLNSPGRGASVFSSLDARDDGSSTNPFAADSRDDAAAATTNPFASSVSPPPLAAASSSSSPSLSSKVNSLTASLLESHPLSGAAISLPSYQDATIAGRSIVQYQLLLRLALPSITSGDPDVDALTTWKRYREFEGLHAAIAATAGKFSLQPPPLPPAPRKGKREEGRAALESYLEDVMAQPLYWDDVGDWVAVRERVEYIAGWKAEQLREAERRRREQEEERLAAIDAAEKLKKQKQGQGKGAATGAAGVNGSSMQVVKVAVERPAGLSYKYQIIAVSVRGWSRWLDDAEGGETEEEEKGRVGRGSRSTLSSPAVTPAAGARGRKVGSANPSLSSSSFYLTVDLPVKTTVGDYTLYKTLQEVTDFRAELARFLASAAATAHLANSLPPLSVPRSLPDVPDVSALLKAADGVEIFFQALVSTSAFQCNPLYAFLARRGREETDEEGERKRRHLISGQKPIASFLVADGEWRDGDAGSAASTAASSKTASPGVSVPGSPALRGEEQTTVKRKRKAAATGRGAAAAATEKKDFANAPLFPEAEGGTGSSHLQPGSGPPSPSMLPSSLTHAPSPLRQESSDPSDSSDSHRFSVSVPSFSPAEPDNPASHILFLITVREYFSLSSFIEWTVTRRYRDFASLHAALSRQFPSYPLPLLPSKKRKVGRRSEAELESRRSQLELFLQQVINVRIFQVDEFFAFFDLQNANRVFSVGTQLQQRDSTPGLDRVQETEAPARTPQLSAAVRGDGRNGGAAAGGGGARQRAHGGANAHRRQPSAAGGGGAVSTNPFG